MNLSKQLANAISIATNAHHDQYDRGGKPYILHPLYLMSQCLFDLELATIAVLHDVVEDSELTLDSLIIQGFSPRVTKALALLTHESHDDYFTYINNMKDNYDAIRVKRKDLEHNSDITRLKGVTSKDLLRMAKYHKAFIILGKFKSKFQ